MAEVLGHQAAPAAYQPDRTDRAPRTSARAPTRAARRSRATPESELFLLAATNMVGEDTFYERADERDARFVELVHR